MENYYYFYYFLPFDNKITPETRIIKPRDYIDTFYYLTYLYQINSLSTFLHPFLVKKKTNKNNGNVFPCKGDFCHTFGTLKYQNVFKKRRVL